VVAIVVTVLPQAAKFKRAALDLLFPRWCLGCGKEGDFICRPCREHLVRVRPPLCPRCGKPQPTDALCSSCLNWPATIDGIRSLFQFEGVIREAVLQLKYKNLRALSETLAELLGDYLIANPLPGEVLVPVPIHPKRLRERGYNQSRLLARKLGKLVKLPVVDNALSRQRHALPQTQTKTVAERRNNVADAFICRDQSLKGRQILLIDDVATSGATLNACAAALKAAGATSVWGLTLAREI
jgi:ComF family protein